MNLNLTTLILMGTDVGMSIGVLITMWLSSPMLKIMWWLKKNHVEIDPELYFGGLIKEK